LGNTTTGLSIIGQTDTALAVQQGGLGIDFGSKLFALKPATLNINQPSTQAEGAIKGHLRVSETGDQFTELFVTLLAMPSEQRQCYIGEPGQLNRTPENLVCFSRDMKYPDAKAKEPQALKCDGCSQSSWDAWRESRSKSDIPKCDAFYLAYLIDTVYKSPLKMYIRSTAKKPFEAGMQQVARTFAKLKASGKNPNIFDIGFKISTKMITTGKNQSWIPVFSDFRAIEEDEREAFGDMYLQFINRGVQSDADAQAEAIAEAEVAVNEAINSAVLEPEYVNNPAVNGEIVL
jgi:hypothetical protein